MSRRAVAVLGYSRRRDRGLNRICAERLAHAQGLAEGACAVVLSGTPEAELMREAWTGPEVELLGDPHSRSTAQNAANVAAAARALEVEELVVVTSRWHRARVRLLLARALRQSGIQLRVEAPPGRGSPLLLARELACFALLPFQLARL